MRPTLSTLLLLLACALPMTARADSVDNFSLTNGIGQNVTFSLPASPPVWGPPNPYLFETFPVTLTFNFEIGGSNVFQGQILFYSAFEGGGLDVIYDHPGGSSQIMDNGDVLYSGSTANPTFLTGTFNVGDTLTITPQASSSMPEPATIILLATGTFGILRFRRRG